MDAIRSLSNLAESAAKIKSQRLLLNNLRLWTVQGVSYFVAAIVLWIIGTIFFKGIGAINWTFLTDIPRDNMSAGGIGPMILGSLYLIVGTLLIVCFIGIPGGIFLAEYAGKGRVVRAIRSLVLSLAGTPSVVYGLFGFAVFVLLITKKSSLIAGWLTLSTMIIPVVVLNTETALKAVPHSQIEAALALGMSKWGAIWKVALPQALPGIMTGLVLASGRAAGEAPPILLTAGIFYTTQQPRGLAIITEPVMNLPYHISEAVKQSGTFKEQTVWGTCLVLMAIILLVNALALYVRSSQRRKNRA